MSSSRRYGRQLVGCLLALLIGSAVHPDFCRANQLEDRLDGVLQQSASGVVGIDILRPWGNDSRDTLSSNHYRSLSGHRLQGSGVVWDADGHIVTVSDLAQPGDTIRVHLADGRAFDAAYVGQDLDLELSMIRITAPVELTPIDRGPSSVPLGERRWIVVLGYPSSGNRPQLAVHRVVGRRILGGLQRARLDLAPNPGLAGGAVLDGAGNLLGVLLGRGNESLLLAGKQRRGQVEYCMGGGRSVTSGWVAALENVAARIDSMRTGQRGREGFLGIRARMPKPGEAEPESLGVSIAEVVRGSPAYTAGIRANDRLLSFAGHPLAGWDELTDHVGGNRAGTDIEIRLLRKGEVHSVTVRLTDRAHFLWKERQKRFVGGRERALRQQIEGMEQELEFLRHLLASYR